MEIGGDGDGSEGGGDGDSTSWRMRSDYGGGCEFRGFSLRPLSERVWCLHIIDRKSVV